MWSGVTHPVLLPHPQLERLVEGISPDRAHLDFRLWLTSMPVRAFPVSVLQVCGSVGVRVNVCVRVIDAAFATLSPPARLQRGIKMTNEPPKGMRANLMGSFGAINEAWFEDCAQPAAWKRLLFGLCFFHAVVQEVRTSRPAPCCCCCP